MDPTNYDVVFNLAQEPYRGWLGAAFPLIFVAFGLAAFFMGERASVKVAGIFVLVFASAMMAAVPTPATQL